MNSEEKYLNKLHHHLKKDEVNIDLTAVEEYISKHAGRQKRIQQKLLITVPLILLLFVGGGVLFQITVNKYKPKIVPSIVVSTPKNVKQKQVEINPQPLTIYKAKNKHKISRPKRQPQEVLILDKVLIQQTPELMIDISDYNNIASPSIVASDYENITTL